MDSVCNQLSLAFCQFFSVGFYCSCVVVINWETSYCNYLACFCFLISNKFLLTPNCATPRVCSCLQNSFVRFWMISQHKACQYCSKFFRAMKTSSSWTSSWVGYMSDLVLCYMLKLSKWLQLYHWGKVMEII